MSTPPENAAPYIISTQLTAVQVIKRDCIALKMSSKFRNFLFHCPPVLIQSHLVLVTS